MTDFLDTNILLYSVSRDPAEQSKRAVAIDLLDRDDMALSVQVFQEFYVQATRPTRSDPLPHSIAVGLMQTWLRFKIQDMTVAVMQSALGIRSDHGFSYWDSAILAAAQALGCPAVYSEDMAHERVIGGVRIVNPFL